MIKTWHKLISFGLFLLCLFIASPTSVSAVDCADVPISGNYSVSTTCAFASTVNGVDAGTGTTNTAVLTVATGGSLSILNGQTIATGSISLTGGSLTIIDGSSINVGTPLYATDADSDHYPLSSTLYTSFDTGRARRNTLTTLTTIDCNDSGTSSGNVWISAACYVDGDNDNYGSTTAATCTNNATCDSATWGSGGEGTVAASSNFSTNNTDCNDANASIWILRYQCQTCCEQRLITDPCGCANITFDCLGFCQYADCTDPAYQCEYCDVNFDCNCGDVCTI